MAISQKKLDRHQMYAVTYRHGTGDLSYRVPSLEDIKGFEEAKNLVSRKLLEKSEIFPTEAAPPVTRDSRLRLYGIENWTEAFNPRQLLTLVTYCELINEAKNKIQNTLEHEQMEAICSYLSFVLDRCIDYNSRLSGWHSGHPSADRASKTHSLNISWSYPELSGAGILWHWCADTITSEYEKLCGLVGNTSESIPGLLLLRLKKVSIF
jgi:adenine-specific DNA methylase